MVGYIPVVIWRDAKLEEESSFMAKESFLVIGTRVDFYMASSMVEVLTILRAGRFEEDSGWAESIKKGQLFPGSF